MTINNGPQPKALALELNYPILGAEKKSSKHEREYFVGVKRKKNKYSGSVSVCNLNVNWGGRRRLRGGTSCLQGRHTQPHRSYGDNHLEDQTGDCPTDMTVPATSRDTSDGF